MGVVVDGLTIQFRDATSGVTTHGSSRAVTIPAPDPDNRVVIDLYLLAAPAQSVSRTVSPGAAWGMRRAGMTPSRPAW